MEALISDTQKKKVVFMIRGDGKAYSRRDFMRGIEAKKYRIKIFPEPDN